MKVTTSVTAMPLATALTSVDLSPNPVPTLAATT
jgi:hypothetical protein